MAYLIDMRPLPTGGPQDTYRVLSDADNLDDALTEGLDAIRQKVGCKTAMVLTVARTEYAPRGYREAMPQHDLYASGEPVGGKPGILTVNDLIDIVGADPEAPVRLAVRINGAAVSFPIHAVAMPGEIPADAVETPCVWLAGGLPDGLAPDEAWTPR